MKKKISVLLAVVCLLVSVFTLTGCGGEDYSDSPYVGTWVGTTAEYMGLELSVAELYGEFSITLEANGKASVATADGDATGKWEPSDNGVLLKDSDQDMEFTADGDTLTMEQDGVVIRFEKQ